MFTHIQMGLQIDDLNSRSYWSVNFECLSGERSNLFQEQPIRERVSSINMKPLLSFEILKISNIAPVLLNLERV